MTVDLNAAMQKPWHKRHDDFECYDKITMEVVPRYKTSGLSGDEWRQHVEVKFWFKGHEIASHWSRDMRTAAMLFGSWLIGDGSGIENKILKLEKDLCDQPSCTEPPTHRYILKELFSHQGERLDKTDGYTRPYFRQFCQKHGTRGDCGREDADVNYIKEAI